MMFQRGFKFLSRRAPLYRRWEKATLTAKRFYSSFQKETSFQIVSSTTKFGKGVTSEIGMDIQDLGAKSVMVITDENLSKLPPVTNALKALKDANVSYTLYNKSRVEPTDKSIQHAIDTAIKIEPDVFLAIGGGSAMDTAKAAKLMSHKVNRGRSIYDFVNKPMGKGMPVPFDTRPMICVPTTSGTGSENTGVVIFDVEGLNVKTGIGHKHLKPNFAIIDSENTKTLPKAIIAASGFDVLCHAIESFTAIPFNEREKPEKPSLRPSYQGSNPISDIWAEKTIDMCAKNFQRYYDNPEDEEAGANMILAASFASIGFGNAGVHLCHGMSYPVSGAAHNLGYYPEGYVDLPSPCVPHGQSVVLNAPAVFRFIAPSCTQRIRDTLKILGHQDSEKLLDNQVGDKLADVMIEQMRIMRVPNGLSDVGFKEKDIPELVKGTLPQDRVTKLSPRKFNEKDLANMFEDSMKMW